MSTLADPLADQIASLQNAKLREALNTAHANAPRVSVAPSRWPGDLTVKPSPVPWTLTDNEWEIWDADETSIVHVGGNNAPSIWADLQAAVNGRLIVKAVNAHAELIAALTELVERCDGEEGVRADGSNIQTMRAHAVLAELEAA